MYQAPATQCALGSTKEESCEYTCITPLHYGIAVEFTPLYLYSFLKGGGGGNDVHGTINEPHLPKKNRPRCYAKSSAVQGAFWSIPALISCAGVTRRWGCMILAHLHSQVVNCIIDTLIPMYISIQSGFLDEILQVMTEY